MYTINMIDYADRYLQIAKIFKQDTVTTSEKEDRLLKQVQDLLVTNARLSTELEDAREVIECYVRNNQK